jgi:uncharacterized damage-inducible protein DinB
MKDIPDLLEGLGRSPRILSEFIRSIPSEKLTKKRGDGFWTVAEHAVHLATVQPMLGGRIERFLKEARPEFVPYIPSEDEPVTPPAGIDIAAALSDFSREREKQLDHLRAADTAAWEKTAVHPEYEQYSLYILARHILMHDHWHMYRMEELWLTRDDYLTAVPG